MNNSRIPIFTLRLLNEKLGSGAGARIDRLVKAKDLLSAYSDLCLKKGIDPKLFHNQTICYSSIQVDNYQGAVEYTAIGTPAVNTLFLWYQIAQKEQLICTDNVIELTEFYSPSFLPKAKPYRIKNLMLSKGLQRELVALQTDEKSHARLEKYLFGNLMRFFQHLGFSYDKSQFFLKVQVQQIRRAHYPLPLFRGRQQPSYTLDFDLNFRLPQSLRLGQSTALGYGKVNAHTNQRKARLAYEYQIDKNV